MRTVQKRFEFDAAHRLYRYEGKCAHIHGHRYVVEVIWSREELDEMGMVLDFGSAKSLVTALLDSDWDHALLLHEDDPLVMVLKNASEDGDLDTEFNIYTFSRNPTAEVMAEELFLSIEKLMNAVGMSSKLERVCIYETPGSRADYSGPTEVSNAPIQD